MVNDTPFIIKWSEDGDQRFNWWLRSSPPDRFIGEVTCFSSRIQKPLEGVFFKPDILEVSRLIEEISRVRGQAALSEGDVCGLLALSTLAKPAIVYRYSKGAETNDECARLFLRIIDIMRKYVESTVDAVQSA